MFQLDTISPAVTTVLCRMTRYVIHKQEPSTGPFQQDHFLPSHFYTLFSLMFIFEDVHCYHNLFILPVLVRHTPLLQRCKLSWTQSAVVPISHSKKTPLNATTGHMILQWTVTSMFNDLSTAAFNQQGSKVKEWGDKKTHEVNITTSLILGFLPLHKNVLMNHLPVTGKTK